MKIQILNYLFFCNEKQTTTKKCFTTSFILLFSYCTVIAQNTSYSANSTPVSGINNAAFGYKSLFNTTGSYNTASGIHTLYANTSGSYNTANGFNAMYRNTTGSLNTAAGYQSLYFNTTGSLNTGIGYNTLFYNSTGSNNTASGYQSLLKNTTGNSNTAQGSNTLFNNVTGYENTASGAYALSANINGNQNVSYGTYASFNNSSGSGNTAVGAYALYSTTFGHSNTAIGCSAGPSGGTFSNTTAIGWAATTKASNQVRVGNFYVTSIGGFVNWTNISDARLGKNVEEKVPGLAFINKLRPVTYYLEKNLIASLSNIPDNMKSNIPDGNPMLQTGLLAQEVEKAAAELGYDFSGVDKPKNDGDYYGLRYAEFTLPLIKAVQELSHQNEQQQAINRTVKILKEQNESMKKELDELKMLINTCCKIPVASNSITREGSIKISSKSNY